VEVTMEDFEFCINDFLFNEELNPVLGSSYRTGNSASGTPMLFEVIDDYTFKITFDGPYGGFLAKMSTAASWAGYTNTLKPAHYLKRFHLGYAEEIHGSIEAYYEFIAPFAAAMGYDDPNAPGVWVYVFNQIDVTNWELTDPNDCLTSEFFAGLIDNNFPVLYAWIMESSANNIQTYVRNPYYWKVDDAGNQLPYIDRLLSTYVEDEETFSLNVIAGKVDFTGVTNANYMTLYLENEESGNYRYIAANDPATFGAVHININYGLNADGSVKGDAASKAWQEMVSDIRFRQALMYSIDAEEVSDAIYSGLADANEYYDCTHDIEKANALLDEMGALDINGDGYRETPSGAEFQWQMWMTEGNDFPSFAELYAEYWREIGLNVNIYVTEESLLTASMQANEIPMRIFYSNGPSFWLYLDWNVNIWAPLYQAWFTAGGMAGQITDPDAYLEPTEDVKAFYELVLSMMEVDADTAANVINPQCSQYIADNMYIILPVFNCPSGISYSKDLGNVPTGGTTITHTMNFDMERLFFKNSERH
jgi:peptide/nickel transport system substrate-binding protein